MENDGFVQLATEGAVVVVVGVVVGVVVVVVVVVPIRRKVVVVVAFRRVVVGVVVCGSVVAVAAFSGWFDVVVDDVVGVDFLAASCTAVVPQLVTSNARIDRPTPTVIGLMGHNSNNSPRNREKEVSTMDVPVQPPAQDARALPPVPATRHALIGSS